MIVKLKEIQVIYICPDHNDKYHKRKLHMDNLLNKLQFKNIIHYKSGTEKYPICLNNATIDIFSKYKPPFLLLEDDIQPTQDIPDYLEIPDNTDAFYLGLSGRRAHAFYNYDEGDSKFEHIKNELFKVKNMLGGHAILYLTPNYICNLRNQLITKPDYYNDVIMGQIQNKYNIYCNRKSYFYQSAEFIEGSTNNESMTKIILNNNSVVFVTAFININNLSYEYIEKNYFNYFEKLAKTGIKIILFLDKAYQNYGEILTKKYSNVIIHRYLTKDELHINTLKLPKELPKIRNNQKDNEDYLKLMNNKIFFIEETKNNYNYNYFAWIDFRIYHILTPVSDSIFKDIYNTCYFSKSVYFSGALDNIIYDFDRINWRFLGGFFLIEKTKINYLVNETKKLLEKLPVLTWEVNLWSILEYNSVFDFGWYKGDHNNSILLIN